MTEDIKFTGLRQQLVKTIRNKGISNEDVLAAIGKVQRHLFVESFLHDRAYDDNALPIASGQTISQPYTVAFQTQLLDTKKGEKVLEIGTGSGYQAAVLLEMGVKLFSIERHPLLFKQTSALLTKLGYNPMLFLGDGYVGKPTYGPFHKILITAAAPFIPEALLQQLKVGGRLVAPVGEAGLQVMTSVDKVAENEYVNQSHGHFVFVPMLPGIAK